MSKYIEYIIGILGVFSLFFVLLQGPQLKDSITSQATLNDYWNNQAELKLYKKLDYEYRNATQIKIVNGVWYMFYRGENHVSGGCDSWLTASLDTRVVKSYDKGQTWSNPVVVAPNELGKPWECAANDGDAYYDASQNKWHLLVQCATADRVWHACHFTKDGQDPMGQFTPDPANPINALNSIWQSICDNPNDDCYQLARGNNVGEAGTFDIFQKANGYYYVGFHGAYNDGGRGLGFRGIAKTTDFVNWQAGSGDLPSDSIFDARDSQSWREDWQGYNAAGGAGNILYDNGYYYLFVEAAGQGINCISGQHWDAGLLRSSSLSNTRWEGIPQGNPIVYSYRAPGVQTYGCPLQYVGFFRDDQTGKIYMHYSQVEKDTTIRGVYVAELVKVAGEASPIAIEVPAISAPAATPQPVPDPTPVQTVAPTPTSTLAPMNTPAPIVTTFSVSTPAPINTPVVTTTVYGGVANHDDCFSDDLRTNVGINPATGRYDSGYSSTSHFCNSSNVGQVQACGQSQYRCVNGGYTGFYWYPASQ